MSRFLSPDWFAEVARDAPSPLGAPAPETGQLVLEQVVHGTPDGEVRYRVVVGAGAAYIQAPLATNPNGGPVTPDLTIACDWATAVAMARGELSAQAALMAGRLRVRGNLARLSGRAPDLVGLDPVPEDVRRHTTY
jgi:hypothetical protein